MKHETMICLPEQGDCTIWTSDPYTNYILMQAYVNGNGGVTWIPMENERDDGCGKYSIKRSSISYYLGKFIEKGKHK